MPKIVLFVWLSLFVATIAQGQNLNFSEGIPIVIQDDRSIDPEAGSRAAAGLVLQEEIADSAWWQVKLGGVQLVVGFFSLTFSVAALIIALRENRRQRFLTRPWITQAFELGQPIGPTYLVPNQLELACRPIVSNDGGSIAFNLRTQTVLDPDLKQLDQKLDIKNEEDEGMVLAPSKSSTANYHALSKDWFHKKIKGDAVCYGASKSVYRNEGGNTWHSTTSYFTIYLLRHSELNDDHTVMIQMGPRASVAD